MKIQFDNQTEIDMFKILLDNLVSLAGLEEDEQNFINRIFEELKKNHIDVQGREDTQGLIDKRLLLD